MFRIKPSVPVAGLVVIVASIQPAFALQAVPAPLVGAGLPVLAVLAGGYWVVRKFRQHR